MVYGVEILRRGKRKERERESCIGIEGNQEILRASSRRIDSSFGFLSLKTDDLIISWWRGRRKIRDGLESGIKVCQYYSSVLMVRPENNVIFHVVSYDVYVCFFPVILPKGFQWTLAPNWSSYFSVHNFYCENYESAEDLWWLCPSIWLHITVIYFLNDPRFPLPRPFVIQSIRCTSWATSLQCISL